MSEHILVQHAKRKKFMEKPDIPEGAVFDHVQGFWKERENPLVDISEFREQGMTKKCDLETGEDLKGE